MVRENFYRSRCNYIRQQSVQASSSLSFTLKLAWFFRYEKNLAAEALRRNENDIQKALDDLINPETNSVIQVSWIASLL